MPGVQINRWLPALYRYQTHGEAEVIEGAHMRQISGDSYRGMQFVLLPEGQSLPSKAVREMEGATAQYYGGDLLVTGYVEEDENSGLLHREIWIEVKA